MPAPQYLSCKLSDKPRSVDPQPDGLSLEFQKRVRATNYHQDDLRDGWITVVTAIVLVSISLFCLGTAIAKFGQALRMSIQSSALEVPAHVTHQALSQFK